MRRIVVGTLVLAALAGLAPARAAHFRQAFGIIAAPVPVTDARPLTDPARCTKDTQSEFNEGAFGVVLELTEHEADGAHAFDLLDAQMGFTPPPTNFDVTFFADLGSCDPTTLRAPAPAGPPAFAGPGNEHGMIPVGMRWAIVTTTNGAEVPFDLRIFG